MANWRYKITLNQTLSNLADEYDLKCVEEDCPQPVKEAIIKELLKANPLVGFVGQIRASKSIAAVNRVLEQVYNEADRNLIWCGMPN